MEIRCREAKQAATDAEAELTKREQAAEELAQTLQEQEVQQAVLEQQALRSREQVLLRQKTLAKAEQQQQAQPEPQEAPKQETRDTKPIEQDDGYAFVAYVTTGQIGGLVAYCKANGIHGKAMRTYGKKYELTEVE